MSRNYKDLSSRLPISRILTGTFSRNQQGILVNARIIDLRTKMVETTAQSLIPKQYLSGASNSFGRASINRGYLMRGARARPASGQPNPLRWRVMKREAGWLTLSRETSGVVNRKTGKQR
jgi:hypothetical protein